MKGFIWIIIAMVLMITLMNRTPNYKLVSDVQDDTHTSIIAKEEELYLFLTDD